MQAWVYHKQGHPDEVLHKEDRPLPVPSSSQILVKVRCAALNPVGYKTMMYFPSIIKNITKPASPEMDVAGVVVGKGGGVTSFKEGDEVYGIIREANYSKSGLGAMAQYTILEADHAVHKPPNISWQEAAAIPLASITAHQSLVEFGGLQSGNRVFINGGSGGVGTAGVQIAKAHGAHVVASCSARNIDFVKQLGADEVIDYTAVDLPTHLVQNYSNEKKFDIVFDTIGSKPLFTHCEPYLTQKGKYVQVGAPMEGPGIGGILKMFGSIASNQYKPALFGGIRREFKFLMLVERKETMEALNALVKEGKLKPPIDSVFAFDDVHKAYEKILTSRARGKIVVNVSDN